MQNTTPFITATLYQIDWVKKELKSDYIVVAMSGDYVQRGTPAILPKHTRAEMALLCGADLVLELPVQFSSASAEGFSTGAVSLLDGTGVVTHLCFGSESGDTGRFLLAADLLNEEPALYRTLLQKHLREGRSYPAARSLALCEYADRFPSACLRQGDRRPSLFPQQYSGDRILQGDPSP